VVTGGSGVGVDLSQSAGNLVESNKLIGNSTGLDMSNDGSATELPVKETIRANTIVGSGGIGIRAFNAVESKILENKVRGSGDSAQAGILLDGDAGGPGGSLDNVVRSNVVTGSAGNGLTLAADSSENRIKNNVLSANDDNGVEVRDDADDNVMSANQTNENGNDGLIVDDPVAVSEVPDVVSDGTANRNGFLATASGENTGNDQGFGMDVATDTDGTGNTAKKNDNTQQCSPNSFC
jgi:parallel beta-helix repeat protein